MTAEVKTWPVEYKNELLLGNQDKSIAVCSLWSDREYVAGKVGVDNVVVVGNLYSHGPGIEGIVRNVLANPSIRGIVIAGKDKSQSADTLVQFSRGCARNKSRLDCTSSRRNFKGRPAGWYENC